MFALPRSRELASLDLRDVTERLVTLVEAEARQKDVTLELTAPDTPVPVSGDRDQLAQVGMNIVINGIKAIGDAGGRIALTVVPEHEPGRCAVRIENDGPAIPEDQLETIFDPFHTGDDDGTGLGLAISSRILEQHDGYLTVENAGLGVRFTVVLSLSPSP